MRIDFGFPPGSAAVRELVDQRLAEASGTNGVPETIKVEFRGMPLNVQVIDVPVNQLYYNPGTHRIRAQRSHDPAKDRLLDDDPWSAESQEYLHYLLTSQPADPSRRDPRFDELKESLREYRQLEPGLITRSGILVNGNTRRAALKELGELSTRVGVLPESCGWDDIHAVELTLQLRQDHRRDYSYINHLLALEEQITLGLELTGITKIFHTTVGALERDVWILSSLRDLVSRSSNGPFSLRLMDFENAKEKLFELHRSVKSERHKETAELLKEARLAAITLDFAKTDVRYIGADFQSRYLEVHLPPDLKPSAPAQAAKVIPGLNRAVPAIAPKVAAARVLTDKVLKLKAVEAAGVKATPEELAEASKAKESLLDAFNEAITAAGRDVRLRKKRQAAPDRINDACKDLEQCVTDLVMSRANRSLDEEAFDDALVRLRDFLNQVATEADKTIKLPGDGLAWLSAAVRK
ncbi:hypothetical protein GCM10010435_84830 [Winogradskya consettensis]|uniref:Uncharacterized protein n=1 Tax=Winogradskya consettensis TaxID=113560 RepID=A0A919SJK0_9ACTN|nr:transcriptional regulator [Actinoplanes consettensis]GIM72692.1 hypothetical protein Aco04nite_31570 [Actinoplanes consettensis]